MTPAARVAAAIDILDEILSGIAAEKALTGWGRRNRYAGSSDRAAIRDLVFQAVRQRRSYGYLGGSETGRGLMVGWALASGPDCTALFSGDKYAPKLLSPDEKTERSLSDAPMGVRLDCPDWLVDRFEATLGDKLEAVLHLMQARASVFLRVNSRKGSLDGAQTILATTDIATQPHPLSDLALEVTNNPRRVAQNPAYIDGLVELQDVASQAVVDLLPLSDGQTILDFCAGGGGKSLAMAAMADISVTAHDIDPKRMKDIPSRAKRANAAIHLAETADIADETFDLVLVDAPCSGSGSWRRSPDAKWVLTADRLGELVEIQASIMQKAAGHVAAQGVLAFVTCSLFAEENAGQIERFLAQRPDWLLLEQRQFTPLDGGDGFFVALLRAV